MLLTLLYSLGHTTLRMSNCYFYNWLSCTCRRWRSPSPGRDTGRCRLDRSPDDETSSTWLDRAMSRRRTIAGPHGWRRSHFDALCTKYVLYCHLSKFLNYSLGLGHFYNISKIIKEKNTKYTKTNHITSIDLVLVLSSVWSKKTAKVQDVWVWLMHVLWKKQNTYRGIRRQGNRVNHGDVMT